MDRIRVELDRTGGFAGLTLHKALDTGDLSDEEGRELAGLVDAAVRATPVPPPPQPVPDSMHYDLRITRNDDVFRLNFDDTTVPPDVRPLLERLVHDR